MAMEYFRQAVALAKKEGPETVLYVVDSIGRAGEYALTMSLLFDYFGSPDTQLFIDAMGTAFNDQDFNLALATAADISHPTLRQRSYRAIAIQEIGSDDPVAVEKLLVDYYEVFGY